MKTPPPANQTYKRIINRRNSYRKFIAISIISIIVCGIIFEENTVFLIFGAFGVGFIGWSLALHFTMCPKCYGLFFGPSYTEKGTAILPGIFFSNNKCNNCDYCGE